MAQMAWTAIWAIPRSTLHVRKLGNVVPSFRTTPAPQDSKWRRTFGTTLVSGKLYLWVGYPALFGPSYLSRVSKGLEDHECLFCSVHFPFWRIFYGFVVGVSGQLPVFIFWLICIHSLNGFALFAFDSLMHIQNLLRHQVLCTCASKISVRRET